MNKERLLKLAGVRVILEGLDSVKDEYEKALQSQPNDTDDLTIIRDIAYAAERSEAAEAIEMIIAIIDR